MRLSQLLAFASTLAMGIASSSIAFAQDVPQNAVQNAEQPPSEAPTASSAAVLNGIEDRQVSDLIVPSSEITSQETVDIDTAGRQPIVILPYDNGEPSQSTQIESRRILITPPATPPNVN